jgi:putative ABC transport system permease protein
MIELQRIRLWLRALFRPRTVERELRDEVRHHLDMETEKNIRSGMGPVDARRKALVDFGGVEQFKEKTREVGLLQPLEGALRDLRFALRRLRRSPTSSLAIILCLGLGLGATSGVFSFFFGIVLRPLPFPDADELAVLFETSPEFTRASPSSTDLERWRENTRSFSGLGGYSRAQLTVTGEGGPEILLGTRVSHDLFGILRVGPVLGRGFGPDDDGPGALPTVILSHALWQERFGGTPDVLGRTITLDGASHAVVGVMAPGFSFPDEALFWVPLWTNASTRAKGLVAALGRLSPGVTLEVARLDMARVAAIMREAYPESKAQREISVRPLEEDLLWGLKTPVTLFLLVAAFVLLLAMANVANLLLAQGSTRGREMVVRTAMGAGRGRVVRQLLTESLLLAVVGGGVGVALGVLGRNLYLSLLPEDFPYYLDFGVDAPVLAVLGLLTLGVGLLFGLAPALETTRVDLFAVLRGGGESGVGMKRNSRGGGWRFRRSLLALQTGLALVVLVGAGMMARSLGTLRGVEAGLNPENLLTMQVVTSHGLRDDDERLHLALREIRDRVASVPGVEAAAMISHLPVVGAANGSSLHVEGTVAPPPGQEPWVITKQSQPGYFGTMGIPLREGRDFTPDDGAPGSPGVVIVNERFARRYWPGEPAVGRRIKYGRPDSEFPWMEVVGVASDVRHFGLERPVELGIYEPLRQLPYFRENLVIRTAGDPLDLVRAVLAEVRAVDPDAPVQNVRTMEDILFRSYWRPVVLTRLLWIFSGMALLLAALGVYGLVAFSTAQRRKEFSIRMALGAEKGMVLGQAVGTTLTPALTGMACGILVAWMGMRYAASLMYGVETLGLGVTAGAVATMVGVALLATYLPARRAAALDPAEVLKGD